MKYKEYEIWHDEYKDPETGAYTHGVLLLPTSVKSEVIKHLKELRDEFGYSHTSKKGFGGSLRNKKRANFLRNKLEFGKDLLNVKIGNKIDFFHINGKFKYLKEYKPFKTIVRELPFGCKLGILVIQKNHKDMSGESYSNKIETTMRFCFKGLLHWAFQKENIKIVKMYFDGMEHHGRCYDISRIIKGGFRNNIKINESLIIDERQRKDRKDDTAIIIDLIDALVGCLYNKLYTKKINDKHKALIPFDEIIDRLRKGHTEKQINSRWYKSLVVSEMHLTEDEEPHFDFRTIQFAKNPNQPSLL